MQYITTFESSQKPEGTEVSLEKSKHCTVLQSARLASESESQVDITVLTV